MIQQERSNWRWFHLFLLLSDLQSNQSRPDAAQRGVERLELDMSKNYPALVVHLDDIFVQTMINDPTFVGDTEK